MEAEVYRDFQVRRDDLGETRWIDAPARTGEDLEPGQVLVDIDRFALTANNITYAVTGDSIGYWGFFPAPDGWGRVPVWGFGSVSASTVAGLAVGERLYGYFPMANQLTLSPARLDASGFFDASPARHSVSSVYDHYTRCATDPGYARADEELIALFRPLLVTAFLLEDFLADRGTFGAAQVLVTSASSKTALGAAAISGFRGDREASWIGLTSPGHVSFVASTGYYHRVAAYDQLESIDASVPTVVLDFSGSAALKSALRERLDALCQWILVGVTHHQESAGLEDAGEDETFFFAPSHSRQCVAEWGRDGFQERYGAVEKRFNQAARAWLDLRHHRDPAAIEAIFGAFVRGECDPQLGHICQP